MALGRRDGRAPEIGDVQPPEPQSFGRESLRNALGSAFVLGKYFIFLNIALQICKNVMQLSKEDEDKNFDAQFTGHDRALVLSLGKPPIGGLRLLCYPSHCVFVRRGHDINLVYVY